MQTAVGVPLPIDINLFIGINGNCHIQPDAGISLDQGTRRSGYKLIK